MRDEKGLIKGGCLCGAVRYELLERPLQTTLCHCEDCRRASGAPVVAWTFCKTGSLNWVKGRPKVIHFSERERSFCGDCGTPLMFFDPSISELFEVSTNSLDAPDQYPPVDQCWVADALAWLDGLPQLPRFDHSAPLPES